MIDRYIVLKFFKDLEEKGDFDTAKELLWSFYFLDSDLVKLKSLISEVESMGYDYAGFFEAEMRDQEAPQEFYLQIEKRMKNDVASLDAINQRFYRLAEKYSVEYDGFDVGH